MKKCLIKKWVPIAFEDEKRTKRIPKTGCWADTFDQPGIFHQWGSAYEEFEGGPGNYTIALVELEDGTIAETLPANIKFLT